jgi:hypothetical protein
MVVFSTAGAFTGSTKGTIWEKIHNPDFSLSDFYSPQEMYDTSQLFLTKKEQPHIFHPLLDSDHTYLGSSITVNNKPSGYIGMVDINAPFTGGQISIIRHITHALKLYFQNNSIYMRMFENNVNYLESLLDGTNISEDIISHYLDRMKWKLNGEFCFFIFTSRSDFSIPIMSVSYIKQLYDIFCLAFFLKCYKIK